MIETQLNDLQEFLDYYINTFKICKSSFVANRYMKEKLDIPAKVLRMRKKPAHIKELIQTLRKEFTKLINRYVKERKLEKTPNYNAYVLVE